MMTTQLSDPVALRMPTDVLEKVDQIAGALDRKRSWVIVRALRRYLATEGQYLLDLAAAQQSAEHESVDAELLLHELSADLEFRKAGSR
jgi:predicted transcriptional regulator